MLIKIPEHNMLIDSEQIKWVKSISERSRENFSVVYNYVRIKLKDESYKETYIDFDTKSKKEADELVAKIYEELHKFGTLNTLSDFYPAYNVEKCNCAIDEELFKKEFNRYWTEYADELQKQKTERLLLQVEELQKQIEELQKTRGEE